MVGVDFSSLCLLVIRENGAGLLLSLISFHFYLPVRQNGLAVREKHVLDAFGLSFISASGELCSLLSMHDLTF